MEQPITSSAREKVDEHQREFEVEVGRRIGVNRSWTGQGDEVEYWCNRLYDSGYESRISWELASEQPKQKRLGKDAGTFELSPGWLKSPVDAPGLSISRKTFSKNQEPYPPRPADLEASKPDVMGAQNLPLLRTSTLQQPLNAGTAGPTAFNPYAIYPSNVKAILNLAGDLNRMADKWTSAEWEAKRRLVQFRRHQCGSLINASFEPVTTEDSISNSICVSCIYWEEKSECYVTTVDVISLLESLVAVRFTVEEKNRIRRNLEGFRPATVSQKSNEEFWKLIMNFPDPKPRNIPKDIKVFPWRILATALKKIIGKYSASYSSTAGAFHAPGPSIYSANQPSQGNMQYRQHQIQSHGQLTPRKLPSHQSLRKLSARIHKLSEQLGTESNDSTVCTMCIRTSCNGCDGTSDEEGGHFASGRHQHSSTSMLSPGDSLSEISLGTTCAAGDSEEAKDICVKSYSQTQETTVRQPTAVADTMSSNLADSRSSVGAPDDDSIEDLKCRTAEIRDLEARTERLLELTKPDTPPGSDYSAMSENDKSPTSEDCDQTSGYRQHGNGHKRARDGSCKLNTGGSSNTGGSADQDDRQPDDLGDSGDNEDDGRQVKRPRGPDTDSSDKKRYPCVYRIGNPVECSSDKARFEHVSQMLRHLESHDVFMCLRCLSTFTSREQKAFHDQMRACVKSCTSRSCKRHIQDVTTMDARCKCVLSSDNHWAAIFRQMFPHLPLPPPWPSKVSPWLLETCNAGDLPIESQLSGSEPYESSQSLGMQSESHQQVFDLNADFIGFNETSWPNADIAAAARHPSLDHQADPYPKYLHDITQSSSMGTAQGTEHDATQYATREDVQRLSAKFALLEQRFERPKPPEQNEKAMLRLAWKHLVEKGDPTVQEGGLLRQFATMLTPEIIEEFPIGPDVVNIPPRMDISESVDWYAAGLAPQQLAASGKGKQRAVPGAADSAYCSGRHMG